MKLKFFNTRPMLAIFLALIVGILLTNYFFMSKISFIILLLAYLVILVFYTIYYKRLVILLVMLTVSIIGSFGLYAQIYNYNKDLVINTGSVIVGRIDRKENKYYNNFIISELKIDNKKCEGRLEVFCIDDTEMNLQEGHTVSFVVKDIERYSFKTDKDIVHEENLELNIKYSVTTEEMIVVESEKSLRSSIKNKVKENLSKGLSNENTELMYSTLFGDKTTINRTIYDQYLITGVGHILAVSGLHVGIIVGLILALFKKIKVNKYFKIVFIFTFLLFYCYLCSWTPSVIRASIMSIILSFAYICFREYDRLSAISFAGSIILLITPSALFNVSFLLSFMSILGITLICPILKKGLMKLNLYNKFTDIILISTAIVFGVMMVSIYIFESINPMGIISNVIVLPIFTLIFSVVFVIGFIPFAGSSLIIINPVIDIVNIAVNFLTNLSRSVIANEVTFLSTLIYAILLMFISKFNLKKGKAKLLSIMAISAILALQIGLSFI